jgi:hypothetical protein
MTSLLDDSVEALRKRKCIASEIVEIGREQCVYSREVGFHVLGAMNSSAELRSAGRRKIVDAIAGSSSAIS